MHLLKLIDQKALGIVLYVNQISNSNMSSLLDIELLRITLVQSFINSEDSHPREEQHLLIFPAMFSAFLLKYLEKRCCELNFDTVDLRFVFRTMQEVGVTLPRLHEMYDRLFKSKVSTKQYSL